MAASAERDVRLTLDRDALKLLFRNALAQKAVRTSAGLLIIKLAAVNKTCLDSIVRVTNQFGNGILTTNNIALKRDGWMGPSIVITRSQFVWMVQWKMLRLQTLTIASKHVRDWHSLIEHFQMPSLRCARPLRRVQPSNPISTSSVVLAADIVKLNSSNIQELDRVPVWKLTDPLPPMHLKKVVYHPQDFITERLDNLSRCAMDVLEVRLHRSQVHLDLDFLAGVDANEIEIWFYAHRDGVDPFTATEGTTNTSVRCVSFYFGSLQLGDVQLFRRFFPNLAEIKIMEDIRSCHRGQPIPRLRNLHEIGQYLASAPEMPMLCGDVDLSLQEEQGVTHSWTVESAMDQLGRRQAEMREALALVPPQLEVSALITTNFHHVGESQTEEADKLASQLGFCLVDVVDNVNLYDLETELAPGRELCICWAVPA